MSQALIDALNRAIECHQGYADAHVTSDGDATSEALYEATYELCHHLSQAVTRNALSHNISGDTARC